MREPPPSRPAFANDGKNLNLDNHDMLLKILRHKVDEEKQAADVVKQAGSDDGIGAMGTGSELPAAIFTPM